jgi:hypothetical protein
MIYKSDFIYQPKLEESEKASYSYIISTLVVIIALPLPIAGLLSTLFYYIANRKDTVFVRWHCLQSLYSQILVFIFNTTCLWWFLSKFIFDEPLPNMFYYYLTFVIILNILEFSFSIYSAIQVRKGQHVQWHIIDKLLYSYLNLKHQG